MLQLFGNGNLNRRQMLQVGTSAFGGVSMAHLLAARANASQAQFVKNRSIVVLNLQGGPTQFETFDPKMEAPSEIRTIFGQTQTSLPGVFFGSQFPQVAKHAHRMTVIRSYRHGISSHGPAAHHVMAGGNNTGAQMGSIYTRAAGLTNPQTGMPRNMVVTAEGVGEKYKGIYASVDRVSQTGVLPASYKPFNLGGGGELVDNMKLRLDSTRLDNRRLLLGELDQLRKSVDDSGLLESSDRFQRQAFDVLAKGVAEAFDLSRENPKLVERYDTAACASKPDVMKRNEYAKQFSPVALGKQMLMARRLVEAGCGFVTVCCGGWDMHGGGKEFTMVDGLNTLTPAVDKAVSAFIEDIHQRGLQDEVLLIITGEFGRTPRINKNGGRDHWGNLCPIVFVGGGLPMGQVIGQSDRHGGEPASDPISSSNILSTVMHYLFDVGELRVQTGIPKEVESIIVDGSPVSQLIS